jgi:hypothetical protein
MRDQREKGVDPQSLYTQSYFFFFTYSVLAGGHEQRPPLYKTCNSSAKIRY